MKHKRLRLNVRHQGNAAPSPNLFHYHVAFHWSAGDAGGFGSDGFNTNGPIVDHSQVRLIEASLAKAIHPHGADGMPIIGGPPSRVVVLSLQLLRAQYVELKQAEQAEISTEPLATSVESSAADLPAAGLPSEPNRLDERV